MIPTFKPDAIIALCEYEDGERRYILAPVGLAAGDTVVSSAAADIKPGNALPLTDTAIGKIVVPQNEKRLPEDPRVRGLDHNYPACSALYHLRSA